MPEVGLTKNKILAELSRSPHGKLAEYIPIGQQAAKNEQEFFAHLIAWDSEKGQVRDAKVALPVISLSVPEFHPELMENSLAHIAKLGPRELLRAIRFAKAVPGIKSATRKKLYALVTAYLRHRERSWNEWQRIAAQHRHTLKELYSLSHTKPGSDNIRAALWAETEDGKKMEVPKGTIFEAIAGLNTMSGVEAAAAIMQWKIPFIVALGALGSKAKDSALVQALIERMSATELVTNTAMLEKLGMKSDPVLRGAYEKALERAQSSTKNVLKTTRAAEAVTDTATKAKLQGLQDKQISKMQVEGNWLVLGDASGSMATSIEVSRQIAGTLAKMVKGKVWLVFFSQLPRTLNVTGLALDEINALTKFVTANGATSIGCGLQHLLDNKEEIDGIAIVSDGGDNTVPLFHTTYAKYSAWAGKEVPVYFYHVRGSDGPVLIQYMQSSHQDMQIFDLQNGVDYYSLPNMVATMRTNRYSLVDEVMNTKLLTLEDVFKEKITLKRKGTSHGNVATVA